MPVNYPVSGNLVQPYATPISLWPGRLVEWMLIQTYLSAFTEQTTGSHKKLNIRYLCLPGFILNFNYDVYYAQK